MQKFIVLLLAIGTVVACSQPKDIYFNGAEGSHSGLKYDPTNKTMSVNQ